MTRTINAAGLALIKQFEGLRLQPYQDQAGIWTVGYGHTGHVPPSEAINETDATTLLLDDLSSVEAFVSSHTPASRTTDNQFAAMCSLAYNVGTGAFATSTVLLMHLAGQYAIAAEAFLMWDKLHIDGVLTASQGLLNRRIAERSLYLMPPVVVSA